MGVGAMLVLGSWLGFGWGYGSGSRRPGLRRPNRWTRRVRRAGLDGAGKIRSLNGKGDGKTWWMPIFMHQCQWTEAEWMAVYTSK